jgi:hypothetical protein
MQILVVFLYKNNEQFENKEIRKIHLKLHPMWGKRNPHTLLVGM